jgi:hypothetical protein
VHGLLDSPEEEEHAAHHHAEAVYKGRRRVHCCREARQRPPKGEADLNELMSRPTPALVEQPGVGVAVMIVSMAATGALGQRIERL